MDPETFAKCCEECRQALLGYAYTCCRDLAAAEDILQETLLIAFRKRDQYFPQANFRAWLIAIARNVWLREQERRRSAARASRFLAENAALWFGQDAFSDEQWEQERQALAQCLEKLDPLDQATIHAHFGKNRSYGQIAAEGGRTVSWVKVRMFRARTTLLQCVRRTLREKVEPVKERKLA